MPIERVKSYLLGLQDSICKDWKRKTARAASKRTCGNARPVAVAAHGCWSRVTYLNRPGSISHMFLVTACHHPQPLRDLNWKGVIFRRWVFHWSSIHATPMCPPVTPMYASLSPASPVPKKDEDDSIWWFGGGYDLTPYYPNMEDVIHWHRQPRKPASHLAMMFIPATKNGAMTISISNTAMKPAVSAACFSMT